MRAYDLPLYMAKLYINFSYVKHAFLIFQPPPITVDVVTREFEEYVQYCGISLSVRTYYALLVRRLY